jgi:hypothetical protein
MPANGQQDEVGIDRRQRHEQQQTHRKPGISIRAILAQAWRFSSLAEGLPDASRSMID